MSFNQGYQDGLGGLKRPSNGDWGSFSAGHSARQEQAFYSGMQRQQNSWSNSNPSSSWSLASSSPPAAEWTAADQAAFDEFWSGVGFVLLMAWFCFVCAIAFAILGIFWLLRAMISITALIGRLRSPAGLKVVVRCLDPAHAALRTTEEWVGAAALWLLELFTPKTENADPPKG